MPAPEVPGWRVLDRLGAGGQATVWLVEGEQGEQAALKIPTDADVDLERLALDGKTHPHVVPLLGTVTTDQGPGLLSRYLPGGSLAGLVQARGPMSVGQCVSVLTPLARAVQSLHEASIVHGDVSPANVLFDLDGAAFLADLGAASVVGAGARLGGTPGFAAPEVEEALASTDGGPPRPQEGSAEAEVRGHGTVTDAADVYGLAAVGWYCLTGRAPGPYVHRAPLPVLVPDVPLELALALESALEVDARLRPSAAEFADAVSSTAECEPVRLHGAVSAETELVLPTVRPAVQSDGPPRERRRRDRGTGQGTPWAGGRAARGGRRWVLGAAAGLAAVTALGAMWAAGSAPQTSAAPEGSAASSAQPTAESSAESTDRPSTASAPASSRTSSAAPGSSLSPATSPGAAPGTSPASSPRTSTSTPTAQDLAALGRARTAALTDPGHAEVGAYTARESPAWFEERALVERLVTAGDRFHGVDITVEQTGPAQPLDEGVRVPVRLTTSEHELVDVQTGQTRLRNEATGAVAAELEVRREDGSWKLVELHPPAEAEPGPVP